MTTSHVTYFSCVFVCCLALPVYIYRTVCSYIHTLRLFPTALPCVRLVVLAQQSWPHKVSHLPATTLASFQASCHTKDSCCACGDLSPVSWQYVHQFAVTSDEKTLFDALSVHQSHNLQRINPPGRCCRLCSHAYRSSSSPARTEAINDPQHTS